MPAKTEKPKKKDGTRLIKRSQSNVSAVSEKSDTTKPATSDQLAGETSASTDSTSTEKPNKTKKDKHKKSKTD